MKQPHGPPMTPLTRGLLRLWVALSVLWIVAVVVVTWQALPIGGLLSDQEVGVDLGKPVPWSAVRVFFSKEFDSYEAKLTMKRGALIALILPLLALPIGAAFVWVVRGFRRQ